MELVKSKIRYIKVQFFEYTWKKMELKNPFQSIRKWISKLENGRVIVLLKSNKS